MLASDVTAHIFTRYEEGQLVTMCGWCRRVEVDGAWFPAPRPALTAIQASYTLSHSICPECLVGVDRPPPA